MNPVLIMVIGKVAGMTSQGPITVGEFLRLPLVEALEMVARDTVTLAAWDEQQLPDPELLSRRGRYQRRDLRAEE